MAIILIQISFAKVFTLPFFWKKKILSIIISACQFPCSTCFGSENGECLSCISPLIKNGTTCISEAQCNQNGFIDSNRNCQGSFLFLFSFFLTLNNNKNKNKF